MNFRLQATFEKAILISISALLFIAFFDINDWVFANLEYKHGVNWIFLPAGFRIILVLTIGLPASTGIMLGTWFLDRATFGPGNSAVILLNGVVSGFTPWLIMKTLEKCGKLSPQLQQFSITQLLNFTLIYAAGNALLHQLCWWLLDHASVNPWVDIWPMFIGDVLGALIMLYAFKGVLNLFSPAAQPSPSDRL